MLTALTSLAFEIAAERARCLILKTEHELSVVGDASDKIGVAYFLIGRWEPSSDLSFFTTSRSTPHPLRVLAGLSPRQAYNAFNTALIYSKIDIKSWHSAWQKMVNRHPIIRTTYTAAEGKIFQVIHKQHLFPLQEIDASHWTEDDLKEKIFL